MEKDDLETGLRKAYWRLIPLVMLMYFMSFINRVNIGFAAITMNKEIGLTPALFGLGAGIFAVTYCILEVPSNLALMRFGARRWIARILISWGVISTCFAFIQGPGSFFAMRMLLGAAEAGFFPGIILYLTFWFPAPRRAGVMATFMAAAPISSALGAPISGVIMSAVGAGKTLGLSDWQWLFMVEGLPTVVLGFAALWLMTDRPRDAAWLSPGEREAIEKVIAVENAEKGPKAQHKVLESLTNPRVLALGLIYLGTSAGLYTMGIWAPQIFNQYGLNKLQVGVLTAIPSALAVIAMIYWARHSDRTRERTWHVVAPALMAAAGLLWAGHVGSVVGCLVAMSIASVGISACKPPLWSMPTMFLGGSGAAAGIALINAIGNIGGAVGPYAIGQIKESTGSYAGGLYVVAGLLVLSAFLTWIMSRQAAREKKAAALRAAAHSAA